MNDLPRPLPEHDPTELLVGSTIEGDYHRLVADGSADLQTVTTADGVFRWVSPASVALFGWQPRELVGQNINAFCHLDDLVLLGTTWGEPLTEPPGAATTVFRFRCASGTFRWVEAASTSAAIRGQQLVISAIREISDRRRTELDLQRQASTDPLTGLANRSVFIDHLRMALRRLERTAGLVTVMYLDLDHFKLVNDSLGHGGGDLVLVEMAARLRRFMRTADTLARLGGDEFAILSEDLSQPPQAVALAARILDAGRVPFEVGHEHLVCTTSAGIAVTRDPHHRAEDLLHQADLALYRAKGRGRDAAVAFDEDTRSETASRLGIERMVRRAVMEGRLRLHLQPIVDLVTGQTVTAEALVRVWDPEQRDLVAAAAFIEVAEESGLLTGMDEWVLGRALSRMATWVVRTGGPVPDVSINVSARNLADPRFPGSVINALETHELPPGTLQLELTERVLMEASNSARSSLLDLRSTGIRVGLDNFGLGYSSLSFLRSFPLDFVKIDRSFIVGVTSSAVDRGIVSSIIDLSNALEMTVVAEGVETAAQIHELRALGCHQAQGFAFGLDSLSPTGPPRTA